MFTYVAGFANRRGESFLAAIEDTENWLSFSILEMTAGMCYRTRICTSPEMEPQHHKVRVGMWHLGDTENKIYFTNTDALLVLRALMDVFTELIRDPEFRGKADEIIAAAEGAMA